MDPIDSSEHPPPSFELCLPPSWRRASDPDVGVLVRARGPGSSSPRPEVVVRATVTDLDLPGFADDVIDELALRLGGFALEDHDLYDLDGTPVCYRRYAHRSRGHELLSDLWAWRAGFWGLTLTGTVAREAYWDYSDLFDMIAESVRLDGLAA